jgi:hypothetical protein
MKTDIKTIGLPSPIRERAFLSEEPIIPFANTRLQSLNVPICKKRGSSTYTDKIRHRALADKRNLLNIKKAQEQAINSLHRSIHEGNKTTFPHILGNDYN